MTAAEIHWLSHGPTHHDTDLGTYAKFDLSLGPRAASVDWGDGVDAELQTYEDKL